MPFNTWVTEGCVLMIGANLGYTVLGYVRTQRLLVWFEHEPELQHMIPKAERMVVFHRCTIALLSLALLLAVRMHLANLGVYPFYLPAE